MHIHSPAHIYNHLLGICPGKPMIVPLPTPDVPIIMGEKPLPVFFVFLLIGWSLGPAALEQVAPQHPLLPLH